MTEYHVIYAPEALDDLKDITDYVTSELKSPRTAQHQAERIMDAIGSLSNMPMRHAVADDQSIDSEAIRRMNVANHAVFYAVDEDRREVTVVRILYGRSSKRAFFGSAR